MNPRLHFPSLLKQLVCRDFLLNATALSKYVQTDTQVDLRCASILFASLAIALPSHLINKPPNHVFFFAILKTASNPLATENTPLITLPPAVNIQIPSSSTAVLHQSDSKKQKDATLRRPLPNPSYSAIPIPNSFRYPHYIRISFLPFFFLFFLSSLCQRFFPHRFTLPSHPHHVPSVVPTIANCSLSAILHIFLARRWIDNIRKRSYTKTTHANETFLSRLLLTPRLLSFRVL